MRTIMGRGHFGRLGFLYSSCSEVLDPRQAAPDIKDPMGKYAMMWASAHFALDGLATFVLLNEFFELLGGVRDPALAKSASASDVMSAKDLATLLESELKARREHASNGAVPNGGSSSGSSTSWIVSFDEECVALPGSHSAIT